MNNNWPYRLNVRTGNFLSFTVERYKSFLIYVNHNVLSFLSKTSSNEHPSCLFSHMLSHDALHIVMNSFSCIIQTALYKIITSSKTFITYNACVSVNLINMFDIFLSTHNTILKPVSIKSIKLKNLKTFLVLCFVTC